MNPTVTTAPTRAETYAPTRTTEAPSYADDGHVRAGTGSSTVTAAPTNERARRASRRRADAAAAGPDAGSPSAAGSCGSSADSITPFPFPPRD